MRRQQHSRAASFSKQKPPQTLCVQTPTAVLSVCSPPAKQPSALSASRLVFQPLPPPAPVPGQAAAEQAGATEELSVRQLHAAAPQPALLLHQETGL